MKIRKRRYFRRLALADRMVHAHNGDCIERKEGKKQEKERENTREDILFRRAVNTYSPRSPDWLVANETE